MHTSKLYIIGSFTKVYTEDMFLICIAHVIRMISLFILEVKHIIKK